ncbi:hypothetical protein IFM89_024638, partial [Coptis chinensis]
MANEAEMSSWTDLLHSTNKLLEKASPYPQFPPLQRNLDQLEYLSKKLKAKTLRSETPSKSIAATRLLAREGINAEQLARDLKSFEIKATFEDVFLPSHKALKNIFSSSMLNVHEMAMVSAIQEAQKDNLRCFNDHMLHVMEEDWQKEKLDFLQSLSRFSMLPRTNSSSVVSTTRPGQMASMVSSPQVSAGPAGMDLVPLGNKSVLDQKASVYAGVVRNLNNARERALPFKPATAFKTAYEGLGLSSTGGKSVSMQKIWHLIQTLVAENSVNPRNISRKMSLIIGARRHLEWGHEKHILDTIQSHPVQAALGGAVGNLQRVRAFLRIRLRDYGVLDFDASDARRQPPLDTTWQQIYFCLRTGYYDEARNVALSSRVSQQFAPQLSEWITSGGMVSAETAAAASEECEKMLRMSDRVGRSGGFPVVQIGNSMTVKVEDPFVLDEGMVPYTLDDLQETRDEGFDIDAVHISIALADYGVLMEVWCSILTLSGNLAMALEYYAQAAAAMGGGGVSLLLGLRGAGEEGELRRFLTDRKDQQQFLLFEAARQCQEAGLSEKSVELHKRIGAFSMALETINKYLSEAICALARGRLDGESQTAALIHSGNDILETYKYSGEASVQEREQILEYQTVLRQLEALYYLFTNLLKVALSCLDNMTDSDGVLRALRTK